MRNFCCDKCKYCDTSVALPFKGGKCHGYFGGSKGRLVKATDYCSRGVEGNYEDYLELNRRAIAHIMTDLHGGLKEESEVADGEHKSV